MKKQKIFRLFALFYLSGTLSFFGQSATAQTTVNEVLFFDPYLSPNAWEYMLLNGVPSSGLLKKSCPFNNFILMDGKCINLTNLSQLGAKMNQSIIASFLRSFQDKGIKISNNMCEKKEGIIKFASYNSQSNTMNFCRGYLNLKDTTVLYNDNPSNVKTVAHETWHTIQDCATGLNTSSNVPIAQSNQKLFNTFVSMLDESDLKILNNPKAYSDNQIPYEVEARAMSKDPQRVLKIFREFC